MHLKTILALCAATIFLSGCSATGLTKEGTSDKNVKVSNYDRIKTNSANILVEVQQPQEYFDASTLKNRIESSLKDKGISVNHGPTYKITVYRLQSNGFAQAGRSTVAVGGLLTTLVSHVALNSIKDDPVKWNWGYKIYKDGEELTDFYYHSLICPPGMEQAMDTIMSIMSDTVAEFFEKS